jgi:hypothetical protein
MRREYGRQTVCLNEVPQMNGKGPSVSLVSEVSSFLFAEWSPFFILFFPFQIDVCFFKSSIRCTRALICVRARESGNRKTTDFAD